MDIKFTKEQSELIESFTMVTDTETVAYYIPYWFIPKGDGVYEMQNLDSLPDLLKGIILDQRK